MLRDKATLILVECPTSTDNILVRIALISTAPLCYSDYNTAVPDKSTVKLGVNVAVVGYL